MNRTTSPGEDRRTGDADRLNEQFHTLLREAAGKREGRERIQSTEGAAADKQESADLLALARGQGSGQANHTTSHGPRRPSDSPAKVQRVRA